MTDADHGDYREGESVMIYEPTTLHRLLFKLDKRGHGVKAYEVADHVVWQYVLSNKYASTFNVYEIDDDEWEMIGPEFCTVVLLEWVNLRRLLVKRLQMLPLEGNHSAKARRDDACKYFKRHITQIREFAPERFANKTPKGQKCLRDMTDDLDREWEDATKEEVTPEHNFWGNSDR